MRALLSPVSDRNTEAALQRVVVVRAAVPYQKATDSTNGMGTVCIAPTSAALVGHGKVERLMNCWRWSVLLPVKRLCCSHNGSSS